MSAVATMIALSLFVGLVALLIAFQVTLALGTPWGRLAWGGQHAGKLPLGYRIASAASILVYGFIAALALDAGGAINLFPSGFSHIAMWVVFGYLTLGTLMNALSRSKPERFVMTPVALSLAFLALIIATHPK
ncbi:hypothetical protein GcLGCM259_1586 [Glutamicibacter creatinolyticus]|uniref:Uncharacterized protein n=1 Tax=Glutamicibacter creatinolyticus TaxID=162496 RepID=A0A5B7WTB5_9MICC|nr:hypothetical protein [Glutamicibacter creatinolyticus]QCY47316.1 hypothetical protein GcLGCM259_1586 [Glutamicibacter creatinolyticus]